jgi:purine-binding chemotaxis protein CheW
MTSFGPRRLGAVPAAVVPSEEMVQLVAFELDGGDYAVDIMRLKEVIQPVQITVVPRAPAFLEGVIDLRGAILPVIDLRRRFGLTVSHSAKKKFLIVALDVGLGPGRRLIVALVVDRVRDPLRVAQSELRPAPPLVHIETDARAFRAVVQTGGRLHMLLDLDRLMGPRERALLAGREFGEPT